MGDFVCGRILCVWQNNTGVSKSISNSFVLQIGGEIYGKGEGTNA